MLPDQLQSNAAFVFCKFVGKPQRNAYVTQFGNHIRWNSYTMVGQIRIYILHGKYAIAL